MDQEISDHSQQTISDQESSYSSEDEDGVLLTNKVEEKLLSVVAKLKAKDPQIYKIDKPIFDDSDFEGKNEKKGDKNSNKRQKLSYKDLVTKKDQSDSQDEESQGNKDLNLDQIKSNIKTKLSKNQDDDQDLFKVKKKSHQAKQLTADGKLQEFVSNFSPETSQLLTGLWKNEKKLDKTDIFLRNYIVNEKWKASKFKQEDNLMNEETQKMIDEEDEERSVEMDEFEVKYNFRFQEPGADTIIQYPRQIPESIRNKPDSRKEKRKKVAERKKEEIEELRKQNEQKKLDKKDQILKRIKESQKNEMKNEDQGEESSDYQHDWFFCDDCTKALQQKQQYYVCNECGEYMLCEQCHELIIHKHEMEKAVIPIGAGPPKAEKATKALQKLINCKTCRKKIPQNISHYEYTQKSSHILSTMCERCYDESNLQTKKKFKLVEPSLANVNYQDLLDKNPQKVKELITQKDIDELVDEYIKCDFEDVIGGGLKTKFKYINVKPEGYGLSDEQILYGDDKELNNYVSIKKLGAYDDDNVRLRNNMYERKIKGINKSALQNKKLATRMIGNIQGLRNLKKMKTRAQLLKKRRENREQKLRIVNISNPEDQKSYFLPKSRLESYGLTTEAPQQAQTGNKRNFK